MLTRPIGGAGRAGSIAGTETAGHIVSPSEEPEQIPTAGEEEAPEIDWSHRFGLDARVRLNAPAEIGVAVRAEPVASIDVQKEAQHYRLAALVLTAGASSEARSGVA